MYWGTLAARARAKASVPPGRAVAGTDKVLDKNIAKELIGERSVHDVLNVINDSFVTLRVVARHPAWFDNPAAQAIAVGAPAAAASARLAFKLKRAAAHVVALYVEQDVEHDPAGGVAADGSESAALRDAIDWNALHVHAALVDPADTRAARVIAALTN